MKISNLLPRSGSRSSSRVCEPCTKCAWPASVIEPKVNLEEILRALYDAGVEFVIVGGAAMRFQGSARLTEDLDFCYLRGRKNIERLAKAFAPFHPHLRGALENLPFHLDAATIERGSNSTVLTDLGQIDLLGHVSGLGDYDAVAKEIGNDRDFRF